MLKPTAPSIQQKITRTILLVTGGSLVFACVLLVSLRNAAPSLALGCAFAGALVVAFFLAALCQHAIAGTWDAQQSQIRHLEREVDERKLAEAAHARFNAILEATPDIVGSAAPDGSALYLNRAGRAILGLAEDQDLAGISFFDCYPQWAADLLTREARPHATAHGSWTGETALLVPGGRVIPVSQVLIAHKNSAGELEYFSTVMRDIADRQQAAVELRETQQRLLETSRLAGMAEVATGVLHNVGNVLNSVNVSASLVVEKLRRSKVSKLSQAAALLTARNGDLGDYLMNDPNGRKLPGYLAKLGEFFVAENQELLREVDQLGRNIEHIKEVVAMQQSYAKVSGVLETLTVDRLVEDAIAMNIGAFERHGVVLQRQFAEVPMIQVERHKVLQILINLIRNAKYALDDVQRIDKRITISIARVDDEKIRIAVADNGVGIPPENLDRIFSHGFTTRATGHGFGLHSGALAAHSMGGALSVASLGVRRGATFTLELPINPVAAAVPLPALASL